MSFRALLLALALSPSLPAFAGDPPAEAAAPAMSERVRGDWVISMSPEERRSVELMEFALSEPVPTDEQISAKGLTPDEATVVAMIVGLRRADPASEQIAEMKRVVSDLPNTTLSVTADQLTFGLAGQTAAGRYEVVEATATTLKIRHFPPGGTAKEAVLSFDGDVLVLADGGAQAVRFRRK